ncbi:MAG: helix-turn-helix domain-containing protein [Clostridia bacterium]|nr:helix-turn-helix domain-containing protein [Clostridia bacterium]
MSLYETHMLQDRQLPLICHQGRCTVDGPADAGNWHENIEIILVLDGSGTIINHDKHLSVEKDDILVINANCLHAFSSASELKYYYLIIDRSFCLANHLDTNKIRFESIFRDQEIAEVLCEIVKELDKDENEPYRVQMIRADLLRLMALLCRRHGSLSDEPLTDSHLLSCMKLAIGYLHSESHRDISLEEVAARVGLSKFYFSREFRRVTGYTFLSYINLIRCEKAKQMLAESTLTIGEIGRACGFDNQSYFSRTFLKRTGMLPSAYRAAQKKRKES